MEDIEKRGLPRYLTAYLNYKLGNTISINEDLYNEVPNDLKECVDCIAEGKAVPDPSILASYPICFKEEIIEEVEEHGGSKCKTPVASPAGETYDSEQTVTLNCATDGATIYYTTDSSTPTSSSTEYTSAITISSDTVLKAIAIKEGMEDSDVMTTKYIIFDPSKCKAPTFSIPAGDVVYGTEVTLSCATDGAEIHYVTSQYQTPTEKSALYTGPFTINQNTYIKAIAIKEGLSNSNITEVSYYPYDEVAIENLDAYLKLQNSERRLKVTGLTPENVNGENENGSYDEGTLGYILRQNSTKWVDLSPTDITNCCLYGNELYFCFADCEKLSRGPTVSQHLIGVFSNCTGLYSVYIKYVGNSGFYVDYENVPFCNAGPSYIYTDSLAHQDDIFESLINYTEQIWGDDGYDGHYNRKHLREVIQVKNPDLTEQTPGVYTISQDGTYNISVNCVNTLLNALPNNTEQTPYKLNLLKTEAPDWVQPYDDTPPLVMAVDYSERYVDLSPTTIPSSVTEVSSALYYSSNILKAPTVPNTVTNLSYAFSDSGLVDGSVIHTNNTGDSIDASGMFWNCTNLTTVTFDGSFYNYYLNFDNTFMFEGCTSLQTINVDSYSDKLILYNMCHEADSTDSIVTLEKIVCKEECITVDYDHLSSELNLLYGNSPETPYKLNITNTEPSKWSTTEEDGSSDIGYAICHDEPTLYFDLSSTTIPAGTTSLQQAFNYSSYIVKSPIISSTITNLNSTFNYCSELAEVTINITDFTNVDLSNIFYNCNELENIYVPSASAKTSLINKLVEGTDYPEGMDMGEIIKVQSSDGTSSTR